MENTSGQGKAAVLPEEARGLAWGAFLLTWIWGIFNRTWLALLTFVPLVGFVVWVMLLIKGREWAWQNKHWDSVEHFNRVQRKWAIAGVILLFIPIVAIVAAVLIPMYMASQNPGVPSVPVMPPPVPAVTQKVPETVVAASAPVEVAVQEQPAVESAPEQAEKIAVVTEEPVVTPPARESRKPASRIADNDVELREAPAAVEEVAVSARVPYYSVASAVTPKYNDVMTAVARQDHAAVIQLLDLGWWVDKPDARGYTPLLEAVSIGDEEMAVLLLKRGANPNAIAGDYSPLRLAKRNRDSVMERLLRAYGATVE